MNELNLELKYEPRWYQADFEEAMFTGKKRALLVWHRRSGKDIACLNFMINEMIKKAGVYYYLFPSFKQARKVIWDSIDEQGIPLLNAFPKELIEGKPNQTEMKIRLKNGALFQLIGTDNYDSIAGTNPCGVVLSEFSLQDPTAWQLILSPILVKNGGWAVFNGTPRGKNHQYDLDVVARNNPEKWFYQKLSIDDTKVINHEEIDQERKEGRSEELLQQEYWCSYDRGVDGTYYGRLVTKARVEQRIGNIAYEPRSVVNTYWDCGYGDSTSIIFAQDVGTEFRIIDFYESQGEGIAHYIKHLQSKPYVYGKHYLPHDAGSGSLQTGTSLQAVAKDLGLNTIILPRDDLQLGIEQARTLLNVCYIDEQRCSYLIKCLENYHKRFNDKLNIYSDTPVHDFTSHAADAFRYCAMARILYGKTTSGLTPEKIKDMRQKNLGW